MKQFIHGKQSTYNHNKCRCEACTEAQAVYMRQYRHSEHKLSNAENIKLLEKRIEKLEKSIDMISSV